MDLKNELSSIQSLEYDELLESLEFDREVLNKKIYIVKVLQFAEQLEQFVQSGIFKEHHITHIAIWNDIDRNLCLRFNYVFRDDEGEEIYNYDFKPRAFMYKILEYFSQNSKQEYLKESFCNELLNFKLDENIKENIKEQFLSQEFKTFLNYQYMENSLSDENKKTKKNKL